MNVITSGTDLIKVLPSGNTFNVSMLDAWEELSASQRAYINEYIDSLGQVNMARMKIGLSKQTLNEWMSDPVFSECIESVEEIFTDGLRAVDYMESVTNGKIRGRVLQARSAKGYEPKATKQTNVLIGSGGLGNIVRSLTQEASGKIESQ
jgi:hypothetical protein